MPSYLVDSFGNYITTDADELLFIDDIIAATCVLSSRVLDNGLAVLSNEVDKIFICSQEPTTYTEASSAFALGVKNFGAGGAFSAVSAGSNGRKVSLTSIFDGVVSSSGTVTHWAAVDSTNSRLLARGSISNPGLAQVTIGFSMPSFDITLLGH